MYRFSIFNRSNEVDRQTQSRYYIAVGSWYAIRHENYYHERCSWSWWECRTQKRYLACPDKIRFRGCEVTIIHICICTYKAIIEQSRIEQSRIELTRITAEIQSPTFFFLKPLYKNTCPIFSRQLTNTFQHSAQHPKAS